MDISDGNGMVQGPMGPMSVGEMLDRSFKTVLRNWKAFLLVSLLGLVPMLIYMGTIFGQISDVQTMALLGPTPGVADQMELDVIGNMMGGYSLSLLMSLLLGPLLFGAIVTISAQAFVGREISVGEALRATASRYWPQLGTLLALIVVAFGSLFVMSIAGLIFAVPFALAFGSGALILAPFTVLFVAWIGGLVLLVYIVFWDQVVMVEGISGFSALSRSYHLAKGQFWRLLGLGITFYLLAVLMIMLVALPLGLIAALAPGATTMWIMGVGLLLAYSGVTPFVLTGITLTYFDLRMRKEGLDLEMLAQSSAEAPVTP